jgi:error-prone DNA polymerase
LRTEIAKQIEACQPFRSVDDLRRRTELNHAEITTLAEIGALNILGMKRREALWQIERAWRPAGALYEEFDEQTGGSPLREMTVSERMNADYRGTGVTVGPHPMRLLRQELDARNILSAAALRRVANEQRVRIAGSVIARQRPSTAKGVLFISLEDETGISNVIVPVKVLERHRMACVSEPFIEVEGRVQSAHRVVNVRAENIQPMRATAPVSPALMSSHDFH